MTLRDLLAGAGLESSRAPAGDVEVGTLAYDGESVTEGTLFFCVPGFTTDGHDFAAVAVVNVDDEWGARLADELDEAGHGAPVTFAMDREADLRARDVRSAATDTT